MPARGEAATRAAESPLALGHLANHPPAGERPNAIMVLSRETTRCSSGAPHTATLRGARATRQVGDPPHGTAEPATRLTREPLLSFWDVRSTLARTWRL